eukprot:1161069-Pelagomonas_calceolata.AAC.2
MLIFLSSRNPSCWTPHLLFDTNGLHHTRDSQQRVQSANPLGLSQHVLWKGKGYIVVPAYVGSLAEAKKVPVTKPVRSGEQKQKIQSQHFKQAASGHP